MSGYAKSSMSSARAVLCCTNVGAEPGSHACISFRLSWRSWSRHSWTLLRVTSTTTSCIADFELESFRGRLDEQGMAIAENQELSMKSRRKLAEMTRGKHAIPCAWGVASMSSEPHHLNLVMSKVVAPESWRKRL